MAQKIITIQINAATDEDLQKITAVLRNIAQNVPSDSIANTLYPKIIKNPLFFKQVVNNPMLKLFK